MDELERQMGIVREGVAPEWDAERSARVYAGIGQLQRRIAVRRAVTLSTGGTLLAALAVFAWSEREAPIVAERTPAPVAKTPAVVASAPVVAEAPPAASTRELRFADGSRATLASESSAIEIVRDDMDHVELALVSGGARFDVVPRTDRVFQIAAGDFRVHVIGTRFELALADEALRVTVEHGRVRVDGPEGTREVGAGETVLLGAPTQSAQVRGRVRPGARAGQPSWRSAIQSGDYEAADRALQDGAHVDDDPWALMDAADAARLSGRPQGAVGYLEQVIAKHAGSPVAPLAAFTLGRLQLDRLGQPHAAAEAFATSLRLAPNGSLAQDALAREVEAWAKAGATEKAYTRAQAYVSAYPDGRRIKAVRSYAGLEE